MIGLRELFPAVIDQPENDILAAMLTDELAERLNVDPWDVLPDVLHLRQLAQDQLDIDAGARLFKPGAKWRQMILNQIMLQVGANQPGAIDVVLTGGSECVVTRRERRIARNAYRWENVALVGGRWIVRMVDRFIQAEIDERRRARRRARRSGRDPGRAAGGAPEHAPDVRNGGKTRGK